jgi:hypothetical protein
MPERSEGARSGIGLPPGGSGPGTPLNAVRPSVADHQTRQAQTGTRSRSGVSVRSVRHKGPLVGGAVPGQLHSTTGGLRDLADSDRVVAQTQPNPSGR